MREDGGRHPWWFALVPALLLAACGGADPGYWQGYVEGEYVRVSAAAAGRLVALEVARGTDVAEGTPLFTLEQQRERAAVTEFTDRIAAIDAQVAQAKAQLALARTSYKRARELRANGLVPEEQVDQTRTEQARAIARLRELEAQQQSAQAQREQIEWALTQKTVTAPVAGLVEDVLFRVGEWVPAGTPVVSVLPPENRIVRFFVPQADVAALKPGQEVEARCDGCGQPVRLEVSYVSPEVEFTPPVIYSREARQKLVFMVEARPAPAEAMRATPGQPVEVTLVR